MSTVVMKNNSEELILFPSTNLEIQPRGSDLINIHEEDELKHLELITEEYQDVNQDNSKQNGQNYKDQLEEIESQNAEEDLVANYKKNIELNCKQEVQQSVDNSEQLKLIMKEARSESGDSGLFKGKENWLQQTPTIKRKQYNNYSNLDENLNLQSIKLEYKFQEQIPKQHFQQEDQEKNVMSMILEQKKQDILRTEELGYIKSFFKDNQQKFIQSRMFGIQKNQQQVLQEKRTIELQKIEQENKFTLQYLNKRKNQGVKSGIGTFFQLRESTHFIKQQGDLNIKKKYDIQEELKCIDEQSEFKRLQERFILQFNKKPEEGLNFLIDQQVINDNQTEMARVLLTTEGLSKQAIGKLFASEKEWNQSIMRKYIRMINFGGMQIDQALREFLGLFQLPQESQQIERILTAFSASYWEDNPDEFIHEDEPFVVTYALMMLHTSLYNPNQKSQQPKKEFCDLVICAQPALKRSKEKLEEMYDRIKAEEFETKVDGIEMIYNRLYSGQQNINIDDNEVLDKLEIGHKFTKYGRKGKPKQRQVYFSSKDQKIY